MRHPFEGALTEQLQPTRRAALGRIAAAAAGVVGLSGAAAASTERLGEEGDVVPARAITTEGGFNEEGGMAMTRAIPESGHLSSRGLYEEGGAQPVLPRPQPTDLKAEQLQVLWSDLADPNKAHSSLYQLAVCKQTVPFLKERLQPADQPKPGVVDQLIVELDDGTFATRQKATTALEKIGLPAVGPLQKALEAKPTLEVRRRIEGILAGIQKVRVQAQHAIQVLSMHGTSEAMACLVSLCEGAKDSILTADANAVVATMGHHCWNGWSMGIARIQMDPYDQLNKLKQPKELPRQQDSRE